MADPKNPNDPTSGLPEVRRQRREHEGDVQGPPPKDATKPSPESQQRPDWRRPEQPAPSAPQQIDTHEPTGENH